METGVYQVQLKDGRLFRIFYANSTQKNKLLKQFNSIKDKIEIVKTITNGINTAKEFEQHLKNLNP